MKRERVNFANILIAAGFNRSRVIALLGIPLAVEITIEASAIDRHEVNIIYNASDKVAVYLPGKTFAPETPLTPNFDHVESLVVNDGLDGDWSISRSKLGIKYSDGSKSAYYFGEESTGSRFNSKRPVIHRATIPPANGWPELKTENLQYPITIN